MVGLLSGSVELCLGECLVGEEGGSLSNRVDLVWVNGCVVKVDHSTDRYARTDWDVTAAAHNGYAAGIFVTFIITGKGAKGDRAL